MYLFVVTFVAVVVLALSVLFDEFLLFPLERTFIIDRNSNSNKKYNRIKINNWIMNFLFCFDLEKDQEKKLWRNLQNRMNRIMERDVASDGAQIGKHLLRLYPGRNPAPVIQHVASTVSHANFNRNYNGNWIRSGVWACVIRELEDANESNIEECQFKRVPGQRSNRWRIETRLTQSPIPVGWYNNQQRKYEVNKTNRLVLMRMRLVDSRGCPSLNHCIEGSGLPRERQRSIILAWLFTVTSFFSIVAAGARAETPDTNVWMTLLIHCQWRTWNNNTAIWRWHIWMWALQLRNSLRPPWWGVGRCHWQRDSANRHADRR